MDVTEWFQSLVDTIAFTGGFRVLIAAVLGVMLGLERQFSNKDAGLRTYALVASGSALFTVLSIEGFDAADTSRVAAQIVTGIGFLGAGLIFRRGVNVQGLTTAAGLWSVAAIGMAAGTGLWGLAIVVTVIVLFVLKVSDHFSKQLRSQAFRGSHWSVRLTVANPSTIEDVRTIIAGLAPTASRPLPDIGHWAVGQKKGVPTITLILNDTELNQLVPVFESHEGISKIRIQETN
ncbi:MAG: MgtC/SapB family protein [Actinomycetota bacterium]|nr:MgtC/SapB family protein [Actinomycetota bacterium]MDK1096906.1 MgtC/SapB family protein [Actinomycetota bacterium]MDK1291659.1 MgtC/SapB family protein [Actinomycetota bacterium]